MKNFFLHITSIKEASAKIGKDTKIWHWSHISSNVIIGKKCVLGQNVFVGNGVKIGDNVKIQNNVSIYDGVTIENDVFVGPSVVFTNIMLPRSFKNQKKKFIKTIVKKGSSIGANSTIVCGNIIGQYSMIGAGSLVTKNVKSFSLYYGHPAKFINKIDKNGKKIR